ncbi:MAG: hypothetical protein K6A65_01610 [Succinivibrionaceae bacterium]|nr:hypothetical protein [Succinivibrionaceae bacterium]
MNATKCQTLPRIQALLGDRQAAPLLYDTSLSLARRRAAPGPALAQLEGLAWDQLARILRIPDRRRREGLAQRRMGISPALCCYLSLQPRIPWARLRDPFALSFTLSERSQREAIRALKGRVAMSTGPTPGTANQALWYLLDIVRESGPRVAQVRTGLSPALTGLLLGAASHDLLRLPELGLECRLRCGEAVIANLIAAHGAARVAQLRQRKLLECLSQSLAARAQGGGMPW